MHERNGGATVNVRETVLPFECFNSQRKHGVTREAQETIIFLLSLLFPCATVFLFTGPDLPSSLLANIIQIYLYNVMISNFPQTTQITDCYREWERNKVWGWWAMSPVCLYFSPSKDILLAFFFFPRKWCYTENAFSGRTWSLVFLKYGFIRNMAAF